MLKMLSTGGTSLESLSLIKVIAQWEVVVLVLLMPLVSYIAYLFISMDKIWLDGIHRRVHKMQSSFVEVLHVSLKVGVVALTLS